MDLNKLISLINTTKLTVTPMVMVKPQPIHTQDPE